MFLASNLQTLA